LADKTNPRLRPAGLDLSFALASSKQLSVLWRDHIFLKKKNFVWRYSPGDEKAAMFLAELLKSLKFNQITDPAGSRLLPLCLQQALVDPGARLAVFHAGTSVARFDSPKIFSGHSQM
jgi:hypothetical protein